MSKFNPSSNTSTVPCGKNGRLPFQNIFVESTSGFEMSVTYFKCMFVCFVCFVALRPKSTAMVIAGRSVHLTTLFPGQA